MATTKVLLCVAVFLVINVASMDVTVSNVKKAVWGSNVTFTATVSGFKDDDILSLKFYDDATPQHSTEVKPTSNVTIWTVEYPKSLYEPRDYTIKVDLSKFNYIFWYHVASAKTTFQLTESLNGNLTLHQNNVELKNSFVAVNTTVQHYIKLPENELQYLRENTSSIEIFWYMDCVPIGSTDDFSMNYTYTDTMTDHYIVAIIDANNALTPSLTTTTPATTTTSTTPSTTTEKQNATENHTTENQTTMKSQTTTEKQTSEKQTTTENQTTTETQTITDNQTTAGQVTTSKPSVIVPVTEMSNATVVPLDQHSINKTRRKRSVADNSNCVKPFVPVGKEDTYGRYETTLSVREPITMVNITGPTWLQHGDLLNLQVKYTGSPPFVYCVSYKRGLYNVTSNETCDENSKIEITANTFPLVHYFADSDQHTVVVVITNDIGKNVSQSTVNIYKTPVHPQLSVIVVPVFFCLVAVILVVFGIAYYQHRSRHTVEVADFDFGQAHPDSKTFRERLRDSFRNAFNFGNRDDTDPLTTNSRYDSMSSS